MATPGGHGTLTRVWARVGSRPRAIRQTQYDYLYVWSAVCPQTGEACGLVSPEVNIGVMDSFLAQFSRELPDDVHAVMVLDRAGWHTSGKVRAPANVMLVHLPPKSPEFNPVENLWHYLRSHHWSNRLYATWDDRRAAATDAWRKVCLKPDLARSVCADTALRGNQMESVLPRLWTASSWSGQKSPSGSTGVARSKNNEKPPMRGLVVTSVIEGL